MHRGRSDAQAGQAICRGGHTRGLDEQDVLQMFRRVWPLDKYSMTQDYGVWCTILFHNFVSAVVSAQPFYFFSTVKISFAEYPQTWFECLL